MTVITITVLVVQIQTLDQRITTICCTITVVNHIVPACGPIVLSITEDNSPRKGITLIEAYV